MVILDPGYFTRIGLFFSLSFIIFKLYNKMGLRNYSVKTNIYLFAIGNFNIFDSVE
jgi:hypothetical protein